MSRVGRLPVTVPSGVQVDIQGLNVRVKGPKGLMERTFAPGVTFQMEDGHVVVHARIGSANASVRCMGRPAR